jgi:protoporphyrinogen oxidase
LFHEELGYIDGGSETLVRALVDAIEKKGGSVRLGAPVTEVVVDSGRVKGVRSGDTVEVFDAVISTVPTPFVSKLIPELPGDVKRAYEAIRNIGVVCVVFKLRKSVTPNFWANVFDRRWRSQASSSFRASGQQATRSSSYPTTCRRRAPGGRNENDELIDEAFGYLKRVNPSLTDSDRIDAAAGRLSHAQPVCPPGFSAMIPKVQTPIAGLQVADTCFYYPEDRGVSEGVRWARLMAEAIDDPSIWDRNH